MTIAEIMAKMQAGYPFWLDWSAVEDDLRALVLAETLRNAAVVVDVLKSKECGNVNPVRVALEECYDRILATSPGKGGG